ncbi:carboxymuconolactone decarboxylase family protein [Actinomadura sp. NEAU-AAG7]|uniref:carboxymuconolactone decarboxylase family protein n=1 Tax=Actinomadura sp. NEAU-AAG7 TaxID=2839640 RepID=UPI001BE4D527|nr:peroxidase-related enzyme [Actinomadura sp. NEAU-AAG7]MBT2212763.1 peroxidase-related enzyme [Actinomadura sp. NEAU-AAG7]
MPHITMPPELMPGTPGLMRYRPETGRPLSQLAEVLLRGEHSLSRADRELIAAHVSALNDCRFCLHTHGEVSAQQHAEGRTLVDKVLADPASAPISPKLKALLAIAGAVSGSGHDVTEEMVEAARDAGATDTELHDAVLIAAAFCMYNRYCDGLAAVVPEDPAAYVPMAAMIIREGYSTCATGH